MKELIIELVAHMREIGPAFTWFEIYTTWITIAVIFIIDNTLRHQYNKKLKVLHDDNQKEFTKRLDAARFEVKRLKNTIHHFEIRDGGSGSLMDIKPYKSRLRFVSYSKSDKVDYNFTFDQNHNYPKVEVQ